MWSLGVILYEILSGARPFEGGSQTDILAAIIARDPTPLRTVNRNIPPGVADLVAALLVKDRDRRLQNATEVLEKLHQISTLAAGRGLERVNADGLAAAVVFVLLAGSAAAWYAVRAVSRPMGQGRGDSANRALHRER